MASDTSQTVDKALRLFDFYTGQEELGISELAVKMHTDKATIFRLVGSLTNAGFLQKNKATKKYRLGLRLQYLGELVKERNEIARQAAPIMKKISDKYQLTTLLCILDHNQIRIIEKVSSGPFVYMSARVGVSMPAYSMASGKLLLAHSGEENIQEYLSSVELKPLTPNTITDPDRFRDTLAEILAQGYAADNDESNIGLSCLSVPVFWGEGREILALDASGMSEVIHMNQGSILSDLKEAASTIAALSR